jgi:hypothetical protein
MVYSAVRLVVLMVMVVHGGFYVGERFEDSTALLALRMSLFRRSSSIVLVFRLLAGQPLRERFQAYV